MELEKAFLKVKVLWGVQLQLSLCVWYLSMHVCVCANVHMCACIDTLLSDSTSPERQEDISCP